MTVCIGIDWSQAQHDVYVLDAAGEPLAHVILPPPGGLRPVGGASSGPEVSPAEWLVGIEMAHTLVIDYLLRK